MKLSTYIQKFPRSERAKVRRAIASACGVSEVAVRHWANGTRKPPAERWAGIQSATKGAVTPRDLRPEAFGDHQ